MPFLHCEYCESYMGSYEERKIRQEEYKKQGFHPRRSLDEAGYGYLSAQNLERRNKDQVLTRFQKNQKEKTVISAPDLLVVVDQLWLWILDHGR